MEEYGGSRAALYSLQKTIDVVRSGGCRTVVIENRYVDADYRSDYSAFWSRRFADTPAFARRLHFFKEIISDEDVHALPPNHGYLGYSVVRPIDLGPLGRTLVEPPPELKSATSGRDSALILVNDTPVLFGNRLSVRGAPFIQQDTEFLRCAHAAAWMCHYAAARRGLVARQLTDAFVAATPSMLSVERPLPSKGMTLNQLQAVFGAFGQPALFYGLGRMPRVQGVDNPAPGVDENGEALPPGLWDTRIFSVVCRYLNSGYPVLIATEDHAFVIVGWYRENGQVRFVANDDQRGPYGVIESPFNDPRGIWRSIMVPLPPRVLMSGESAENDAHTTLRGWGAVPNAPAQWQSLATGVADKSVSVRTVLRDASEYKIELADRGLRPDVVRLIRLARLPHFIWVVEAHDRAARDGGEPCVIAEVVYDSTSHDLRPTRSLLLLPGLAVAFPPDAARPVYRVTSDARWESALPLTEPFA